MEPEGFASPCHAVVFDVNVYLDAAELLGPPFTWEKFATAAARSERPGFVAISLASSKAASPLTPFRCRAVQQPTLPVGSAPLTGGPHRSWPAHRHYSQARSSPRSKAAAWGWQNSRPSNKVGLSSRTRSSVARSVHPG
jgi:hypothetical protein